MNEIKIFVAVAERYSFELSQLNRRDQLIAEDIEGTHPNDTQGLECLIERRLELDRSLFRIRNELEEASKTLIASLKKQGETEAAHAVSKTTLAAWHYNGKFQSEWFTCHAILRASCQADMKPKTRVQPEHEVTQWVRKNWQRWKYVKSATVRAYMEEFDIAEWQYESLYRQVDNDSRKSKKPLKKPKSKGKVS